MTINITKKKNEELVRKFGVLKEFVLKNSKDEVLIENLHEIEQKICEKKYGLIFEKHKEKNEDFVKNHQLEFSENTELSIIGKRNGIEHFLIESENLLALKVLERKYKKRITVISIDPPYNTGNEFLIYNDSDYEDSNDVYSHSKWLSFMEKRLRIAYELLVPNGVMFINIDETQIGCLILLCQQIFQEKNVDVLIWPKIDPKYDENRVEKPFFNVQITHEYVILCYKDRKSTKFNKMLRRPNYSDFSELEKNFSMETILNELGTTSSAKDELKAIFGSREVFSTPKPRKMIKEFIRVASGPNSIILDFFAGSGTAGHAVIDLNNEDGGQRQFILINNNENNICREIAYERIKRVIKTSQYEDSLKYYQIQSVYRQGVGRT